jgi:hypothetical protein
MFHDLKPVDVVRKVEKIGDKLYLVFLVSYEELPVSGM